MMKRIKHVWMKINFKINYFLWKLKLLAKDTQNDYNYHLYGEYLVKESVKHIASNPEELFTNTFAGEVNWDTWQTRINDKILEKELKSDKEHLGDQ
jgi:hypothetical protein